MAKLLKSYLPSHRGLIIKVMNEIISKVCTVEGKNTLFNDYECALLTYVSKLKRNPVYNKIKGCTLNLRSLAEDP